MGVMGLVSKFVDLKMQVTNQKSDRKTYGRPVSKCRCSFIIAGQTKRKGLGMGRGGGSVRRIVETTMTLQIIHFDSLALLQKNIDIITEFYLSHFTTREKNHEIALQKFPH